MSNNKLSLTLGVTPNEYTILEAYYTQILASNWAHKEPHVGLLNDKADSPICDHLSPYDEKMVYGAAFKELLATDRTVKYATDDPYGVYLTIEGTKKRYSFLVNAGKYSKNLFFVYQLGAKPTKSAPGLGHVLGGLVRLSDTHTATYGSPLFRDALRVYEQILEFHVLPRTGKEDTLPTPAELLAILQGYGEYPDIDSVIATAAKKEDARVVSSKKSADLKESPEKPKRTKKKKPARIKRTTAEWATLWSVAAYILPIIATVSAYLITGNIVFALTIGVFACLPLLCNGWSFVDELLDTQDEGGERSTGDK